MHMRLGTFLLLVLLLAPFSSSVWARGYSIRSDRVIINSKQHWSDWTLPGDVLQITDDGRIHPRFIRKNINAVLDAAEFIHGKGVQGGISGAGSNPQDAAKIIDGDLDTFWEPNINDPLSNWWVEIDLGRVVSATKVVLRFVEEGRGDPFLQFKVLSSAGDLAFPVGSQLLDFRLVGKTEKPNKDRRVFEYELSPKAVACEGWTGAVLQYLRIVVTDSDFDKAEEVTKSEYDALGPEARGAIEYFGKSTFGGERPVSQEIYYLLDPGERGPIKHYRRESPRLADVEVWSVGDNIGLGILKRGGSISVTGVGRAMDAFDGEFTSYWWAMVYSPYRERGVLMVDLGTVFWVDAIRLMGMVMKDVYPFEGYVIRGSDGSKAPDGSLIWDVLSPREREDNVNRALRFADEFEPRKLRFLDFKNIDITGQKAGQYEQGGSLSEFQIYGEGYVPEVKLTSDLIELGGARNLTWIEWAGNAPPGTGIEIRTRTGDELKEVKHFFNASGKEITERAWNSLPGFAKGPVTSEWIPGSDWSSWSQVHLNPGDRITSPSPRKYLLIEVKLISDDPNLAPSLASITVHFLKPLARELVGEISPRADVPPAKPQKFVLFIKPTFMPTNPGFDEILVQAPSGVGMDLLSLGLGNEEDFPNDRAEFFLPDDDGVFLNPSGDTLDVVRNRSDSLWVRLPRVVRTRGPGLVRIVFRSSIFLNGTVFKASVGNTSISDSWQRVDPGDATFLSSSREMTVSTLIESRIIGDVEIDPNPFTPNGDEVNDEVVFNFSVFKVNRDKPLGVMIYNLSGQLVKKLWEGRLSVAGEYSIPWSGEDEFGELVPPGIYLAQISIEVDSGSARDSILNRLVYVAY